MNILTELDDGRVAVVSTDDTLKTGDSIELKSSNGECVTRVVKEVVHQAKRLSIVTLEDLPTPKPVNMFKKLENGSWGALVADKNVKTGDVVTLTKKDGSSQDKMVETIVGLVDEGVLVTFVEVPKSKKVNNGYKWVKIWEGWGVAGDIQAGLRSDGAWFYRYKEGASNYRGGSNGRWVDWYQVRDFIMKDESFDYVTGGRREQYSLRHSHEKLCSFSAGGYEPKRIACPQQHKIEFGEYSFDKNDIQNGVPDYY